jgi:hypothetical protein
MGPKITVCPVQPAEKGGPDYRIMFLVAITDLFYQSQVRTFSVMQPVFRRLIP